MYPGLHNLPSAISVRALSLLGMGTNTRKTYVPKEIGEVRRTGYLVGGDRDMRAVCRETCETLRLI